MFILKYKKIFFILATVLVIGSLVTIITKGFNLGIDFTGGSVLEVSYITDRPLLDTVRASLQEKFPNAQVQYIGDAGILVRTEPLDQESKQSLVDALTFDNVNPIEERFNTIGPSVGRELRSKAILSIIIVSVLIILFIAFVFRHVAKPVSSWVYGGIAALVLIHDVIIPAGIFAWLGLPIDTLFIVGLLTVLGVSVNDTIVVFDRVRENLREKTGHIAPYEFAEIVGSSIKQTLVRSVMTSVTVLVVLAALWIWGPAATKTLSIAMFLGMLFGTYSSIFLAAPLLVVWNNWRSDR